MTTYKKLTWDSYKIQVESAVRDGNGATISTTYATKTEVTTGLGTKLDTTVAASTYATQTALAGKADKATSLAGYGITDGVTTNTAQTIDGLKTFSSPTDAYTMIWKSKTVARGDAVTGFTRLNQIQLQDKNGDAVGYIQNYLDGAGNTVTNYGTTSPSGSNRELRVVSGTDGYVTVPYRTYNSANINDIVTIGSLASNPSVVHTTGNEEIAGQKTFTSNQLIKGADFSSGVFQQTPFLISRLGTSLAEARFNMLHDTNDSVAIILGAQDATGKSAYLRVNNYPANNLTELVLITRNGTWHTIATFTD